AANASQLDLIMVSTDDSEIAEISQNLGAKVPALRPKHLASDRSPTIDTVIYTLEFFLRKGIGFDAVCLLQPTSPMRSAKDIDQAITAFKKQQTDSLISVLPVPHEYNPHWTFEVEKASNRLKIATGETAIITRRQELPTAYHRNGAIYLTKTSVILDQKSLYGDTIGYYVMSSDNHVNIDTLDDWEKAEQLLLHLDNE
ncbi:MAG: acylneuraminate cytidylyltransferase family protein, partial [Bacteroidota bacterium]